MRCKKEGRDEIAYCCPTIPCPYEEGSLNLQMLLSSPRSDSETKEKKRKDILKLIFLHDIF